MLHLPEIMMNHSRVVVKFKKQVKFLHKLLKSNKGFNLWNRKNIELSAK
jgi:hypothetical protein